jgi:hypothetical protein
MPLFFLRHLYGALLSEHANGKFHEDHSLHVAQRFLHEFRFSIWLPPRRNFPLLVSGDYCELLLFVQLVLDYAAGLPSILQCAVPYAKP